MNKNLLVFLLLMAVAVAAIEYTRRPEKVDPPRYKARPTRIVSQTLATDEILLAICDPKRILALSALADDPSYSNVTQEAKAVALRVDRSAEEILKMEPDLVFVSSYSRAEFVELLQAANAPLHKFSSFDTLEDLERNILTIGEVIDEKAKAEALVASMRRELEAIYSSIPKDRPYRVVSYGLSGSTAGRGTLFDNILKSLNLRNLSSENGLEGYSKLSAEQLAKWNPDVIVTSAEPENLESVRRQLLEHPAVAATKAAKTGKIIVIDNRHMLSVSHHIVKGIRALAAGVYED